MEVIFSILWDDRGVSESTQLTTHVYITFGQNGALSRGQFRDSAAEQILSKQLSSKVVNLMPQF